MASDFSFSLRGAAPSVNREELNRVHGELLDAVNKAYASWQSGEGSEQEYEQALRSFNRFIAGGPGETGIHLGYD